MNVFQHDKSTPFEIKSRYCRGARQDLHAKGLFT